MTADPTTRPLLDPDQDAAHARSVLACPAAVTWSADRGHDHRHRSATRPARASASTTATAPPPSTAPPAPASPRPPPAAHAPPSPSPAAWVLPAPRSAAPACSVTGRLDGARHRRSCRCCAEARQTVVLDSGDRAARPPGGGPVGARCAVAPLPLPRARAQPPATSSGSPTTSPRTTRTSCGAPSRPPPATPLEEVARRRPLRADPRGRRRRAGSTSQGAHRSAAHASRARPAAPPSSARCCAASSTPAPAERGDRRLTACERSTRSPTGSGSRARSGSTSTSRSSAARTACSWSTPTPPTPRRARWSRTCVASGAARWSAWSTPTSTSTTPSATPPSARPTARCRSTPTRWPRPPPSRPASARKQEYAADPDDPHREEVLATEVVPADHTFSSALALDLGRPPGGAGPPRSRPHRGRPGGAGARTPTCCSPATWSRSRPRRRTDPTATRWSGR